MKCFFVGMLLLIGTVLPIQAETLVPGTVKGTVIDSKTKQGMEFVNVTVKANGAATVLNAGVTDSQGDFALGGLKTGTYDVVVSCVGYKSVIKTIHLGNTSSAVSLNKISLVEDSHLLKEVSVVGQQPQMKFEIDKKVFNVSQDLSSIGGSASDVLSNIPSINVDNDGNVSLRGNSSVTIWINGKASGLSSDNQAQVLEQLPAESIERIEVITNPSAKYSPEGTAGIINIVLKEDRQLGYFGSVRAGVRSNGSVVSGTSVNYTTSKLDANIDLGYRHMVQDGGSFSHRTNTQGTSDTSDDTFLNQTGERNQNGNGVFLRGGLTYHFNKKDQLYGNGFGILGHGNSNNIINYDQTGAITYKSLRRTDTETDIKGGNATVGFKHAFTQDHYLDFSTSYNKWGMDNDATYNQSYENGFKPSSFQEQVNNINNRNLEFQLDYQNKWDADHKIEAGWKSTLGRENSPIKTYTDPSKSASSFDPSAYNRFIYDQDIHAGYVTYTGKWSKLGYQLGMRGEYTKVKTLSKAWENGAETSGTPYTTDYFKLFPSMYLTYSLPAGNELQLNYSRRINRPWGTQLNSFRNITDSTNISYGNPELKPQYSNSLELNYIKNWDKHMLSFSTYYRTTNDVIQSVSYLQNNIMYSTSINIAKTQSAGVELIEKSSLFKIFDITTTWDGYYYKLNGFNYNATVYAPEERFAWNARMIANVILPYSWSLQMNGNYNSRQSIAQGTSSSNYSVDAGLKKTFLKKKWTLSLNVRDMFNSLGQHNYTSGTSFIQDAKNWRTGRRYGITLTYSFGNMKMKKRPQAQQEDDDSNSTPGATGNGYGQ